MNCSNCKIANQNVPCVPQGNDFKIAIVLKEYIRQDGGISERDVSILGQVEVRVFNEGDKSVLEGSYTPIDSNIIIDFSSQGTNPLAEGGYGIEVKGKRRVDSSDFCFKLPIGLLFIIVSDTTQGFFPTDNIITYTVNGIVGLAQNAGGTEQVQSDWKEADDTSPAFIQNKPTIPSLTGYATINYVNSYVNYSLTGYVTAGYVNSYVSNQLSNYATEQWVNEQNFLKEHQSLDGYATEQWVNEQNFLKQHQDISGKENRMQIVVPNSLTFLADTGKYYRITQSGTITVTLPSVVSDYIEGFLLFFTAAADDCLHFDTQDTVLKADGYEIKAGDICEVNAVYNGDGWQVTVIKFNS